MGWENGGEREGGEGEGDVPVGAELLDPVHDEPEAEARRADGQELRFFVFGYRQELHARRSSVTTNPRRENEREKANEALTEDGSRQAT